MIHYWVEVITVGLLSWCCPGFEVGRAGSENTYWDGGSGVHCQVAGTSQPATIPTLPGMLCLVGQVVY